MKTDTVLLEHGSGGMLTNRLIREMFVGSFSNEHLDRMDDAAVVRVGEGRLCFTTDSFVVDPIFFPGGDIGSLAVHGTVNDIAACAGRPLFLSAGFIIEEGFAMEELARIVDSMARASREAGVKVVTGDTKVVPKGSADKIFITTSGIGVVEYASEVSPSAIREGDAVLISGPVGDHGAAILSTRSDLGMRTRILSDSAPLGGMVQEVLRTGDAVHFMRDPTRGGLAAVLAEAAHAAGLTFEIDEQAVPVREGVRGLCEITGMDPLYLACEGRMVVICEGSGAPGILEIMRSHPLGRDAAIIGRVTRKGTRGRVVLWTIAGGSREVDLPEGELVPRIC
ncbi:MAG TPA: hydrogenase expression/formation protein HypE [Deltaproteobacteria bacterium]|nr:hydrogenase expression/formation protein HypE [Deltaproteobacteria bacterium]